MLSDAGNPVDPQYHILVVAIEHILNIWLFTSI